MSEIDTMFIFHNYPDLHHILGVRNVRFVTTETEIDDAMRATNGALARGEWLGQIPTAHLVERFDRRASLTGPGDAGNDYVFVNAWAAPTSREQAVKNMYGAYAKL